MINSKKSRIKRVRAKISGTASRPRLAVFKSLKKIYAQLIDDEKGTTLASARGENPEAVGKEIAKQAMAKKIKNAVFDRRSYKYHGKIKALAEGARAGGLTI